MAIPFNKFSVLHEGRIGRWTPLLLSVVLAAGTACWWLLGRSLTEKMYQGDFQSFFIVPATLQAAYPPDVLYELMGKALFRATVLCILLSAWSLWISSAAGSATFRERAELSVWVGAGSAVSAAVLLGRGYDSTWYPIGSAMNFTADPPYVHRVLFVWFARLVQHLTGLSEMKSFYASQAAALLLAMGATVTFARIFMDRRQAMYVPIFLAAMLAPTFTYFTFYDIGIVFFYAAGLSFLFRRQYGFYLATVAIGTLNHENILFLIILSLLFISRERNRIWLIGSQFAIYLAVRGALFYAIPVTRAWAKGNVWINVEYLAVHPGEMLGTAMLFLWFAGALAIGWRTAPPALKQCALLLPVLVVTTALVGQFNEARQFDAFLPVAVVMLLQNTGGRDRQRSAGALG